MTGCGSALGRYFTRPLRLTAQEALAVLAGRLMATTGADPGARWPGRSRSCNVVGISERVARGQFGRGRQRNAGAAPAGDDRTTPDRDRLLLYSTDESRVRTIDRTGVYATDGSWYVIGWCHSAEAERLFRVDRIRRAH